MIIFGVVFIVVAGLIFLLSAFASGMSDVPGAKVDGKGFCAALVFVGVVLIALHFLGFHFTPLITR